jgi:hypothetical protein
MTKDPKQANPNDIDHFIKKLEHQLQSLPHDDQQKLITIIKSLIKLANDKQTNGSDQIH